MAIAERELLCGGGAYGERLDFGDGLTSRIGDVERDAGSIRVSREAYAEGGGGSGVKRDAAPGEGQGDIARLDGECVERGVEEGGMDGVPVLGEVVLEDDFGEELAV